MRKTIYVLVLSVFSLTALTGQAFADRVMTLPYFASCFLEPTGVTAFCEGVPLAPGLPQGTHLHLIVNAIRETDRAARFTELWFLEMAHVPNQPPQPPLLAASGEGNAIFSTQNFRSNGGIIFASGMFSGLTGSNYHNSGVFAFTPPAPCPFDPTQTCGTFVLNGELKL